MTKTVTIKLTIEQLRLLRDNFQQSFADGYECNSDLIEICEILTTVLVRKS